MQVFHAGRQTVPAATGGPVYSPGNAKSSYFRAIPQRLTLSQIEICIEQYASAGASGLQYLDNGYWQYNWKTPKTDTGCRTLAVEFNNGQISPVAYIRFK